MCWYLTGWCTSKFSASNSSYEGKCCVVDCTVTHTGTVQVGNFLASQTAVVLWSCQVIMTAINQILVSFWVSVLYRNSRELNLNFHSLKKTTLRNYIEPNSLMYVIPVVDTIVTHFSKHYCIDNSVLKLSLYVLCQVWHLILIWKHSRCLVEMICGNIDWGITENDFTFGN